MTKFSNVTGKPSAPRPAGDFADRVEGRDRRRVRRQVRAAKSAWLEA